MRVTTWLSGLALASAVLMGCPNEPVPEADAGAGAGDGGGAASGSAAQDGGGANADDSAGGVVDAGPGGSTAGRDPDSGGAEDAGAEPADAGPPAFAYECTPGTKEACVTACESAGKRLCLKEWGPCVPPEEFCGNCADDDCDGLVNEGCPPNAACTPVVETCPSATISVVEGVSVGTGTVLHLSAAQSQPQGEITAWAWTAQTPAGAAGSFVPGDAVEETSFATDVAGTYLFGLTVWRGDQVSCSVAQKAVSVNPEPPLDPEVGCADGEREGFLDLDAYTHIAACAGAWDQPGITPPEVTQTCGGQGGDDGSKAEGQGCSAPDLCGVGWHVCDGWQEVAAKSPTGCAGATPPNAKSKSLFFAIRQRSNNGSVCEDGASTNDVFGCGNLGAGLDGPKGCGPLDRVLASTQADSCGFNEAEPPLGPWECKGGPGSDLLEGQTVTKTGCPNSACQYDGAPINSADKGGVLCCRE